MATASPWAGAATPRRLASLLAVIAILAAGCSSDSGSDGAAPTTAARSGSPSSPTAAADPAERTCDQGPTIDPVEAEPVPDPKLDHDWTITSFDGTEIRAHWFPVDGATEEKPAPTVLMGPGWSLAGDTSEQGGTLFAALSIEGLHGEGYNVLTWDPRGFGKSSGVVQVDSPEVEGRDTQVLLDWVAEQPEAQIDTPGDARVGMVGFSYGGGIQLALAGIDCRVDALVPGTAWHSLETSLYENATMKAGWAGLLQSVAGNADLDPHVVSAYRSGLADGTISAEDQEWFRSRGPGDRIDDVDVPTLFLQGTVDTLFPLDEAIANYESLRERKVPTAMLWFCGGHGACLTEAGDPDRTTEASFAWLARYLKGDDSVDTGPEFSFVDQEGTTWTAPTYPTEADDTLTGSGTGTLELTEDSAAGPATIAPGVGGELAGLVAPITPGPAAVAIEVPVETGSVDAMALGTPTVTVSYSGSSPTPGTARVFAQLVDTERNVVIGNQSTPIPLVLDGEPHESSCDLEAIAQRIRPGQTIRLQLTATNVTWAHGVLGGSIDFTEVRATIPVVTDGLTER